MREIKGDEKCWLTVIIKEGTNFDVRPYMKECSIARASAEVSALAGQHPGAEVEGYAMNRRLSGIEVQVALQGKGLSTMTCCMAVLRPEPQVQASAAPANGTPVVAKA